MRFFGFYLPLNIFISSNTIKQLKRVCFVGREAVFIVVYLEFSVFIIVLEIAGYCAKK